MAIHYVSQDITMSDNYAVSDSSVKDGWRVCYSPTISCSGRSLSHTLTFLARSAACSGEKIPVFEAYPVERDEKSRSEKMPSLDFWSSETG